jgi:hypothetical protein
MVAGRVLVIEIVLHGLLGDIACPACVPWYPRHWVGVAHVRLVAVGECRHGSADGGHATAVGTQVVGSCLRRDVAQLLEAKFVMR